MQLATRDHFVELKYCERCGGLWLRRKGVTSVYCAPCQREMAELPAAKAGSGARKFRGKLPGVHAAVLYSSRPAGFLPGGAQ